MAKEAHHYRLSDTRKSVAVVLVCLLAVVVVGHYFLSHVEGDVLHSMAAIGTLPALGGMILGIFLLTTLRYLAPARMHDASLHAAASLRAPPARLTHLLVRSHSREDWIVNHTASPRL